MSCYHCNEVLPAQPFFAELENQQCAFCCAGCMVVAQTIYASGLQRYYQHRSSAAQRSEELPADILAALASEAQQGDSLLRDEHGSRISLLLENLACPACAWLIERHLRSHSAIVSVSVDLSERRVSVQWCEGELSVIDLLGLLQSIGYRALPFNVDHVARALKTESQTLLTRMAVAGLAMMQAMMYSFGLYFGLLSDLQEGDANWLRWAGLLCAIPVMLYSATPFFQNAITALRQRRLNMDVSVSLGLIAAMCAGIFNTLSAQGIVYFDSIAMLVFLLLLGRFVELKIRQRATMAALRKQRSFTRAVLVERLSNWSRVALMEIKIGDKIRVSAGEQIPVDGVVAAGNGLIDESLLTGEAHAQQRNESACVFAGTTVSGGSLDIVVRQTGSATYLAQLTRLQDSALQSRPPFQQIADRIAGVFVGVVLLIASLGFAYWLPINPPRAIAVFIAVLVVTCPCALSLALPTAWAAATRQLLAQGFLIRRAATLETLARITHVVFDKTGTLSHGKLRLDQCVAHGNVTQQDCLRIIAALEQHSNHPLSLLFARFADPKCSASDVKEVAGFGLQGRIDGRDYYFGQRARVATSLANVSVLDSYADDVLVLADDTEVLATLQLMDELKVDALSTATRLKAMGLSLQIISGDNAIAVQNCAQELQIDIWHARQLPEQKLARVRQLQAQGACVLMIGDGINDAPVLGGADVSVAIGSGADHARRAADAVLTNARLTALCDALQVARRTKAIVHQNIMWAIFYNVLALPSALTGLLSPWEAALGMSVSSLLVTLNSMRLHQTKISSPATNTELPDKLSRQQHAEVLI